MQEIVKPENLCYIQGISNIQVSLCYNFQISFTKVFFEDQILKQIFVGHSCIILAKCNVKVVTIIFQKKGFSRVDNITNIDKSFCLPW